MISLTGKIIAFRFFVYLIIGDCFYRIENVMLLKRHAAVVGVPDDGASHDIHLSDMENIKEQLFDVFLEREKWISLNRVRVTYKAKDACQQMANIQSIKLPPIGSKYSLPILKTLFSMSETSCCIFRKWQNTSNV